MEIVGKRKRTAKRKMTVPRLNPGKGVSDTLEDSKVDANNIGGMHVMGTVIPKT